MKYIIEIRSANYLCNVISATEKKNPFKSSFPSPLRFIFVLTTRIKNNQAFKEYPISSNYCIYVYTPNHFSTRFLELTMDIFRRYPTRENARKGADDCSEHARVSIKEMDTVIVRPRRRLGIRANSAH